MMVKGLDTMDDHTDHAALRHVVESVEASVRDIAEGRIHDAVAAQAEALRMLADYEGETASEPAIRVSRADRRVRSSS